MNDFEMNDLDAVLKEAHVISLRCRLTNANRKMINRDSIAQMRDGAILVNTARGGLVDEVAMVAAIKVRNLRGAALDSFENEPLTGNVSLTEHMSVCAKCRRT
jgi:D-3-phosphoglycerate dehydrogenase